MYIVQCAVVADVSGGLRSGYRACPDLVQLRARSRSVVVEIFVDGRGLLRGDPRLVERLSFFFFQAEDGIRDYKVTGVQACALPISSPFRMAAVACRPSISGI